jgi:hypothetical protein
LPLVDADIHAMRGGGVDAASFGIKSLRNEVAIPDNPPCSPLTGDKTKICEPLRPFVDRRVQALLARIERSTPINERVDMGCGTIERKGEKLTIRFHRKAITLLSGDLTGTFAEFRKGKPLHMPHHKGVRLQNTVSSLLQWMIGSDVNETDPFDLVQFMNTMTPLPISGFRRFLSYHKENVTEEDVYRYAMELYGYKTTHYADMMNIYGWIFPPDICIRREGSQWAVNTGGTVKLYDTKEAALPTKKFGITVFNPTAATLMDPPGFMSPMALMAASASTPLTGSSLRSSPASVASAASVASVAIPASTGSLAASTTSLTSNAYEKYVADRVYLISALTSSKNNSVTMKLLEILYREDPQEISNAVDAIKRACAAQYVSRKIVDKVEIPDRQQIG